MRDDEEALHVLVEAVGVFLPDLRTQSVKDMIPAKLQKLKTKYFTSLLLAAALSQNGQMAV